MKKFKNAWNGLMDGFQDKSIKIQYFFALCALGICLLFRFEIHEIICVIFCITIVIVCEYFNTCIEKICDIIQPKTDEKIKTIKDLAAGAVFLSAISSCLVLLLIFVNRI